MSRFLKTACHIYPSRLSTFQASSVPQRMAATHGSSLLSSDSGSRSNIGCSSSLLTYQLCKSSTSVTMQIFPPGRRTYAQSVKSAVFTMRLRWLVFLKWGSAKQKNILSSYQKDYKNILVECQPMTFLLTDSFLKQLCRLFMALVRSTPKFRHSLYPELILSEFIFSPAKLATLSLISSPRISSSLYVLASSNMRPPQPQPISRILGVGPSWTLASCSYSMGQTFVLTTTQSLLLSAMPQEFGKWRAQSANFVFIGVGICKGANGFIWACIL